MTEHDLLRLHRDALVIDAHNDAIVSLIRRGNASISGRSAPHLISRDGTVSRLRDPVSPEEVPFHGQVSVPKLRSGGIDAAFFAVDVTRAWKNHLAYALDALGYFDADVAACPDEVTVALRAADIPAAKAAGRFAAVLVIENSDALEGSLNVLRALHRVGVRSITLTHNPTSWAAAGNAESESGGGLTRFGVRLVREMNDLGMLVDVSHIAERGFWDVLETSSQPVIASHSCCAALCPHPRNLTDAQLRGLAQNGGAVCVTFVPGFLQEGWRRGAPLPPLERLLEHVDHAVQTAGIDHVGIGSDFDGGGIALADASEYPRLTAGLVARGYDEPALRRVLGENVLRVFAAALRE